MTTNDPDPQASADELLERWLAERADEVGLVGTSSSRDASDDAGPDGVSSDAGDGSFDPDPWRGLDLPEAELSAEQLDFLGALDVLPELVRGEDLVDRPAWDIAPDDGAEPAESHDPSDPG